VEQIEVNQQFYSSLFIITAILPLYVCCLFRKVFA